MEETNNEAKSPTSFSTCRHLAEGRVWSASPVCTRAPAASAAGWGVGALRATEGPEGGRGCSLAPWRALSSLLQGEPRGTLPITFDSRQHAPAPPRKGVLRVESRVSRYGLGTNAGTSRSTSRGSELVNTPVVRCLSCKIFTHTEQSYTLQ